jgi:hypothetical protein
MRAGCPFSAAMPTASQADALPQDRFATPAAPGRVEACQTVPASAVAQIADEENPDARHVEGVGHASSAVSAALAGMVFVLQVFPPFEVSTMLPAPRTPHDVADAHEIQSSRKVVGLLRAQVLPASVDRRMTPVVLFDAELIARHVVVERQASEGGVSDEKSEVGSGIRVHLAPASVVLAISTCESTASNPSTRQVDAEGQARSSDAWPAPPPSFDGRPKLGGTGRSFHEAPPLAVVRNTELPPPTMSAAHDDADAHVESSVSLVAGAKSLLTCHDAVCCGAAAAPTTPTPAPAIASPVASTARAARPSLDERRFTWVPLRPASVSRW